jgi:hypothetical protein
MPVEMMSGLPERAARAISGRSMASNEAILKAGAPSLSRSSMAVSSNGEEKQIRPRALAWANRAACHSKGVKASE